MLNIYLPQAVSASVWNIVCKGPTYTTNICPTTDSVTAIKNIRFEKSPIVKTLFVCDRHDKAFHISKNTKHVKVIVVSLAVMPSELN